MWLNEAAEASNFKSLCNVLYFFVPFTYTGSVLRGEKEKPFMFIWIPDVKTDNIILVIAWNSLEQSYETNWTFPPLCYYGDYKLNTAWYFYLVK